MPTDRIGPNTSLLETMRALARDRAKGAEKAASKAPMGSSPRGNATVSAAGSAAELRKRLRSVVADVDVNDTQSLANAREPALREILLWEFGSDFRQSAQFLPMVASIGQALDADEGFQAQFAKMILSLKK